MIPNGREPALTQEETNDPCLGNDPIRTEAWKLARKISEAALSEYNLVRDILMCFPLALGYIARNSIGDRIAQAKYFTIDPDIIDNARCLLITYKKVKQNRKD